MAVVRDDLDRAARRLPTQLPHPHLGEKDDKAMSAVIMEERLIQALAADASLRANGVVVHGSGGSGIEIQQHGDSVGRWRWRKGVFGFLRDGEKEPVREVDTVAEAVHYTAQLAR